MCADINATADNGSTALMMAVRGHHPKTVQLLLERVVKDNEMTEGLKGYILQQIVNFMTFEQ